MPEWVTRAFQHDPNLTLAALALRLFVALLFGCVVAGIYWLANVRGRPREPGGTDGRAAMSLMATLVMLSVLIAMVTLVIGENQARAFSLVGALAIIRFRTVVEDTRDTAFVIFAVAVGMAAGAGYLGVTLLGLPFAAVAAMLFRPRFAPPPPEPATDHLLTVRIGLGRDPEAVLREPLGKHFTTTTLSAATTARQGAQLELTYAVRLRHPEAAAGVVAELNGVEGVQGIELRRG